MCQPQSICHCLDSSEGLSKPNPVWRRVWTNRGLPELCLKAEPTAREAQNSRNCRAEIFLGGECSATSPTRQEMSRPVRGRLVQKSVATHSSDRWAPLCSQGQQNTSSRHKQCLAPQRQGIAETSFGCNCLVLHTSRTSLSGANVLLWRHKTVGSANSHSLLHDLWHGLCPVARPMACSKAYMA